MPRTLSDPINRTPQPDAEHLERLGLMERQVDGDHYLGRRCSHGKLSKPGTLIFSRAQF